MYKKYFIVLSVFCFLLFAQNSYSQWTFAGAVTGAGTSPSISVIDQNTVAVFGGPTGTPRAWISTNGGTTFTQLGFTGLGSNEFFCGWASSSTTMFGGDGGAPGGAGGNASYYITTNGGTSWSTIGSTGGSGGFFNIIMFSRGNPMVGFAQSDPPNGTGQPYYVTLTSNGGANWSTVTCPGVSGCIGSQNSGFIIDAQFFGFGLNGGASRSYITTNGGTSWTASGLGIAGSFVSGLVFNDNKLNGVAVTNTSMPNVSRTTNGGTTWSSLNTGTGIGGYTLLRYIDNSPVVYLAGGTGTSGVIARSNNNGATWTVQTTAGLTVINHMDFVRSGTTVYGYAVAGDGSVLKITDVVTGIEDPSGNVPADYKLEQNYPNPFNPVTTINFSIPKASFVTLKVYDALGKEVASIISKDLQPGSYSQQFVASKNLGSGVYFYRLTAGDFSETKKFILAK